MNKNNKVASDSTQERNMKIVWDDQSGRYVPNARCCALLAEMLPMWVPVYLYFRMTDSLRGHSKGMAMLMTECLIAFVSGDGRRLTRIPHVDNQLLALYSEIYRYAQDHGKKLKPIF